MCCIKPTCKIEIAFHVSAQCPSRRQSPRRGLPHKEWPNTYRAITKDGAIGGYYGVLGFNPTKQIGFVILCSCDNKEDHSAMNWTDNVQLSLLNPSSIFTSGKVPPITNANTSVVSQGNVK